MGINEKKEVILQDLNLQIFNEGKIELADDIISPDYVYHVPGGEVLKGPEGFKQLVMTTRTALPDVHYEFDSMVEEGDWVIALYTMTATHTAEFLGIPATGRKIELKEAYCCRFDNDKVLEAFPYNDTLTFYQQVGAIHQI